MYKHLSTMGAIDLLNSIDPLTVTMLHDFTPVTEGTHVLALETNHSFIELEADEFEAYLREDGLESALEYRQQHGEQQMKGRERYKRCTKLMVQAGEEFDQTYKQPAYMAIEIFPVEHPYKRKEGKPASFKILFENKPLANAKVRCWYKSSTDFNVQIQTSNKKGEVSFEQKGDGRYMISVVHMVRVQNDAKVDWESTWGTLIY